MTLYKMAIPLLLLLFINPVLSGPFNFFQAPMNYMQRSFSGNNNNYYRKQYYPYQRYNYYPRYYMLPVPETIMPQSSSAVYQRNNNTPVQTNDYWQGNWSNERNSQWRSKWANNK